MRPDPTQQYVSESPFVPYRRPRAVWDEYKARWKREHGPRPLPAFHNLPELTGIPARTLARLYPRAERRP